MHRPLTGPDTESIIDLYPVHANLYLLPVQPLPTTLYSVRREEAGRFREEIRFAPVANAVPVDADARYIRWALRGRFLSALSRTGFHVDSERFSDIVRDTKKNLARQKSLRIYPAYEFRILDIGGRFFLCIDHHLKTQLTLSLRALRASNRSFLPYPDQRVFWRRSSGEEWVEAAFALARPNGCDIMLSSGERVEALPNDIVPCLSREQILRMAPALGVSTNDLERTIKQFSFLTGADAPRARLDACSDFVRRLSHEVFPIRDGRTTIGLDPVPAKIRPPVFSVARDLAEPTLAFDHVDQTRRAKDISKGLTTLGAYEKPIGQLKLLVITTVERKAKMEQLVRQLNRGSNRYRGAQLTFGTVFAVQETIVVGCIDDYEESIREFVQTDARKGVDVALVYLPRTGDIHSPAHPYFRTKGLLLREGIASQMVDEPTVQDPTWRDLNLALNIYAKSGYTPWVLDEPMPGVDLFIGLSSSTVRRNGQISRMMGYVNVFDSYGRWRFYRGDLSAFSFDDRLQHFDRLVRDSVAAYRAQNGGLLKSVCIHLTKSFSAEERSILAGAVRSVVPDASILFVWIDPHPILRLYDLSQGSSGEIKRATYLDDEPGRVWLATTGGNEFEQRGMGTPVLLQLTVWSDPKESQPPLRDIAQQVLSLTRLNWGSSRNFSQEPITTKYAGYIAKRMNILIQDPNFFVNPSLRGVPWFL